MSGAVKEEGGAAAPVGEVAPAADGAAPKNHVFKSPKECLLDIVRRCAQHDSSKYFSDPVTEEVAPNYFTIIKNPMDFFTIRKKIVERRYETWRQFVDDLELICTNAMTYNQKRSRVHKAAGHLQRCLRKVLRENELEGRRSILLHHPKATNINQNVVTDVTLEGAYNPEVCDEAWRDEQMAARTAAVRNNLATEKAEERCMAAYIRASCASKALNAPLPKDAVEPATTPKPVPQHQHKSDLVQDWSSYSDTDDERAGAGAESAGSAAAGRPSVAQLDELGPPVSVAEPSAGGGGAPQPKEVKGGAPGNEDFRRMWKEDSKRNEIMWRFRWLERRIRYLEAEERRYGEKAAALSKREGETNTGAEPGPSSSRSAKRRRRAAELKQDFDLEEALPGWIGVFSHLGATGEPKDANSTPMDVEASPGEDSDASENELVEVMEEALMMHKQIHALHAQIAYARQNINRQGKIVHARSTMPPMIDPQILRTRIGARLLALERDQSATQSAANGEDRALLSPGGQAYLADMDAMMSPMGASKIPPPLKVEFINTPGVREVAKPAEKEGDQGGSKGKEEGGAGPTDQKVRASDEESEDTGDDFYERLHRPLEIAERARFVAPVVPGGAAGAPQVGANSSVAHNQTDAGAVKPALQMADQAAANKGRTRNRSIKTLMQ